MIKMTGTITISEVLSMQSPDAIARGVDTVADVLDDKRRDDSYNYLLRQVRLNGLSSLPPIVITFGCVCDGHHRIAVCVDLGITEIEFTDDLEAFAL
jgi:hypothetical protein